MAREQEKPSRLMMGTVTLPFKGKVTRLVAVIPEGTRVQIVRDGKVVHIGSYVMKDGEPYLRWLGLTDRWDYERIRPSDRVELESAPAPTKRTRRKRNSGWLANIRI